MCKEWLIVLHQSIRIVGTFLLTAAVLLGCTNNPYPTAHSGKKIFYSSFSEPPRTLDPAVAYTTSARAITANVYDTLLEYHYLKRPYFLIPGLAQSMPKSRRLPDGREAWRFKIRNGIMFQNDPCFVLSQKKGHKHVTNRQVTATDFAFQIARIADPEVNSPISSNFAVISGFTEFAEKLTARRKTDIEFANLPVHLQYRRAGGIAGVRVLGRLDLEIILKSSDPQILYWFAMPFTTPVAWEAVQYYDGKDGRDRFEDHPVGTGPYTLSVYSKQHKFILERSPTWYGVRASPNEAFGAFFPSQLEAADLNAGYVRASYAGRRLPFIDRIIFTREREGIPRFNKFLQGYYDNGGIIKESFDAIVQSDQLSPEMKAKGMRLDKTVEPSVFYIGFNMTDATVGATAGKRGRKLRQAMSLAIDINRYLRLFFNDRGIPAQSPLPPGLFGYDRNYRNPYRQQNLVQARKLLREAGYANGIDPKTGEALRLSFDTSDTSAQGLLQYEYFVSAWRQLGLNVEINATTYNQFQEKIRNGAFQLFSWGWIADYPDPENFMFLLECSNARSKSGGPNSANFCNKEYDKLYSQMKDLPNTPQRRKLIRQMIAIIERERPWIELFHREAYSLNHAWVINSKPTGLSLPNFKYLDVLPELRTKNRRDWNRPITWPAYVLVLFLIGAIGPAVLTFYKERQ